MRQKSSIKRNAYKNELILAKNFELTTWLDRSHFHPIDLDLASSFGTLNFCSVFLCFIDTHLRSAIIL